MSRSAEGKPAGFPRRLAAIFYDGVVQLALWMVAAAIPLLFTGGTGSSDWNPFMTLLLLAVSFLFFAGFWTRGGRTVGMLAWQIRLERVDGEPVTTRDATIRFLTAIVSWLAFGLGFLWALFDPGRAAWHDRASGTRLIVRHRRPAD